MEQNGFHQTNHASEKARKSSKRKIFGSIYVLEKNIDYIQSFRRTKEEMAKKTPKTAKKRQKSQFFAY